MNVSLTPELEKYINTQVKAGLYHSSSEVIRSALRLLLKFETTHSNIEFENYKMWLRQEVQIGLEQAARGDTISSNELKSHIKERRKNFISDKK